MSASAAGKAKRVRMQGSVGSANRVPAILLEESRAGTGPARTDRHAARIMPAAAPIHLGSGKPKFELDRGRRPSPRSEEHTSELQSRFGISYAVSCLKK